MFTPTYIYFCTTGKNRHKYLAEFAGDQLSDGDQIGGSFSPKVWVKETASTYHQDAEKPTLLYKFCFRMWFRTQGIGSFEKFKPMKIDPKVSFQEPTPREMKRPAFFFQSKCLPQIKHPADIPVIDSPFSQREKLESLQLPLTVQ